MFKEYHTSLALALQSLGIFSIIDIHAELATYCFPNKTCAACKRYRQTVSNVLKSSTHVKCVVLSIIEGIVCYVFLFSLYMIYLMIRKTDARWIVNEMDECCFIHFLCLCPRNKCKTCKSDRKMKNNSIRSGWNKKKELYLQKNTAHMNVVC